jgi:hypothetical protein
MKATRRKAIWALGIIALGAAFLLGWLYTSGSRIDEDSYERIQIGMSLAEVEEIMRRPPGHYKRDGWAAGDSRLAKRASDGEYPGPCAFFTQTGVVTFQGGIDRTSEGRSWHQDGLLIVVALDQDSRVTYKAYEKTPGEWDWRLAIEKKWSRLWD